MFNQRILLFLQFYYNQIANILIPENQWYYLRMLKLKNKFFVNLKKLQSKNRLIFFKNQKNNLNTQQQTLNNYQKIKQMVCKAPINVLIKNLIKKGFYHATRKKPTAQISVINFNDGEIIRFYSQIINNFIYYYKPTNNFIKIKKIVQSLRQSCYLTLAYKHKKSFI